MNIEKMVFNVTETKTYEITVSKETGYDMPETAKELVDMVNDIHTFPSERLDLICQSETDERIEITNYEVITEAI